MVGLKQRPKGTTGLRVGSAWSSYDDHLIYQVVSRSVVTGLCRTAGEQRWEVLLCLTKQNALTVYRLVQAYRLKFHKSLMFTSVIGFRHRNLTHMLY